MSRDADYVVMTHKDAVKLSGRWPGGGATALTAHLALEWQVGSDLLTRRIADLLTGDSPPAMYSASHAGRRTA